MDVIFSATARKQLAAMPKAEAAGLEEALRQIAAAQPQRLSFVTEMAGRPGYWRARKGDYRAVFSIKGGQIDIESVGHRKEIYR